MKRAQENPFVGTWFDVNEYYYEVEFTVSVGPKGTSVEARDPHDGEKAKISNIALLPDHLIFTAHWPSTGRITENRFDLDSADHVRLTFTFTDTTILKRK